MDSFCFENSNPDDVFTTENIKHKMNAINEYLKQNYIIEAKIGITTNSTDPMYLYLFYNHENMDLRIKKHKESYFSPEEDFFTIDKVKQIFDSFVYQYTHDVKSKPQNSIKLYKKTAADLSEVIVKYEELSQKKTLTHEFKFADSNKKTIL